MAVDPSVTFSNAPRPPSGGSSGGAAGSLQIRLAEHTYTGGGSTIAGANRPNPREISNIVFNQLDSNGVLIDKPSEGGFSSLLWVWGQFLDHDLDQTGNGTAFGTAPITVPIGDPVFAPGSTLSFSRSQFITGTGTNASNPRQFDNDVTSLIDGSNIYGSSTAKLDALLEAGTAKLKLTTDGTIGFGANAPVFGNGPITGDTRANENVALLSMHALFAREHNRIVDELATANPSLTTAQLFEGARARVEAIMQAITYKEFLPILIGEHAIADFSGFKASVNPAISLEFSSAVYRFGHSLLSASIDRLNEDGSTHSLGNLALRDAFNTRGVVEQTGIEAIFRGLSDSMSQEFDTFFVEDVRSLLFGNGGPGTDLAALNIQRGRDHGLPTYNGLRVALGLEAKTSFSQVTSDPEMAARLSQAYGGDISKLDLYVGGLAEDPVGGGIMGETYRAVMIDQFTRLRDGDRFWSEGRGFTAAELKELWSTTLSDVIVRNSGVVDLQDNVFEAYNRIAGNNSANTLTGGAGRNLIIGNGGNDTLIGGASDDHMVGGTGADRLEGRAGVNTLIGGAGADTFVIHVDRANQTAIRDFTSLDVITFANTAGVPALTITDGPDGAIIRFGAAVVVVEGVAAADLPFGPPPPPSGVTLTGNANANVLIGGAGDDTLSGLGGNDTLTGLGGNDRLIGGAGNDTLFGGDGADRLEGRTGVDDLTGGTGADTFVIHVDRDNQTTIHDFTAEDTVLFANTGNLPALTVTDGPNGAIVKFGAATVLFEGVAASSLPFGPPVTPGLTLTGTGKGETLTGGAGADKLSGLGGADVLNGLGGADTLDGGSGRDVLDGDTGADIFLIRGTEAQTDTMMGGAGTDLIRVDGTGDVTLNGTALITGIEIFEGNGADLRGSTGADVFDFASFASVTGIATIRGLAGNDRITGSSRADVIRGDIGNDTLNGAGGDDRLIGNSGADTFLFVAGQTSGQNTIADFDASGDDVLQFSGYGFGSANPGGLSTAAKLSAVAAATTFAGGDAIIDLDALGGSGSIHLENVSAARLTFTAEDFLFT